MTTDKILVAMAEYISAKRAFETLKAEYEACNNRLVKGRRLLGEAEDNMHKQLQELLADIERQQTVKTKAPPPPPESQNSAYKKI